MNSTKIVVETMNSTCACPVFLTGLGLVLGSQFIYMVSYQFPTTSSSQPDYLAALLRPRETLPSPLSSSLRLVLSLFSSLLSLSMTNPFSLLTSFIYSLRLVEYSSLNYGVNGSALILYVMTQGKALATSALYLKMTSHN